MAASVIFRGEFTGRAGAVGVGTSQGEAGSGIINLMWAGNW